MLQRNLGTLDFIACIALLQPGHIDEVDQTIKCNRIAISICDKIAFVKREKHSVLRHQGGH